MDHDSQTRVSLLLQLHDLDNQVAWERFVDLYGPRIYSWCTHWGLQQADAEDVAQNLILKLFHRLRDFEYDRSKGSFRGWLKTVTQNALRDFARRQKRTPDAAADSDAWDMLHNEPAREDFSRRIEQAFDLELLDEARRRVQKRVAAHTWQAFELIEQGDLPVGEIAEQVGMQVAMVYVARSKVKKMLKEELAME